MILSIAGVSRSWAALGFSMLLSLGCGGPSRSSYQTDSGSSSGGNEDGGTSPQTDGGSVVPPGPTPVASLVSQSLFEQLFLHRGTAPCQGSFYTYQSFIDAAKSFPDFAQQGTLDDRKREIAAFFANASHETTGGWATAPDGQYAWGLCWINEGGAVMQTADYCVASADYPCAAGKKYYGRGPLQISYNYNYGQAGKALGANLLGQPELVASDPVLAWKTALWFWMTTQQPKPSCHDVVTGRWTPTASDLSAGRKPGFGLTINIINGGVECNQPTPEQVKDRVGFYNRYSQILGVDPGSNLTCDKMQSY